MKKLPTKVRFGFLLVLILLVLIGVVRGVTMVNDWFNTHYFEFRSPIAFAAPMSIKAREPQIIEKKVHLEYPEEIDTPIEQYICDKWGTYECKTALAVSKAENDTRQPDRFNVNTDGSIDVGIFQINSVHFEKPGCSLAEIVDAQKNVDCAYQIWEASNWNPWVAYWSGSYLAKLGE